MMACPKCGVINEDNWPVTVNGVVIDGGCQECWEAEADRAWWNLVVALDVVGAI